MFFFFFFQAEDGIRDLYVTGVQTCALPIWVPGCPLQPGERVLRAARFEPHAPGGPETVRDRSVEPHHPAAHGAGVAIPASGGLDSLLLDARRLVAARRSHHR